MHILTAVYTKHADILPCETNCKCRCSCRSTVKHHYQSCLLPRVPRPHPGMAWHYWVNNDRIRNKKNHRTLLLPL